MIELLVFVAVVTWLVRQFYGARAKRWEARGRALLPVLVVLGQDARAISASVSRPFRARRDFRGLDVDAEFRDMLGG